VFGGHKEVDCVGMVAMRRLSGGGNTHCKPEELSKHAGMMEYLPFQQEYISLNL
jgi:hypothetical protein